MNEARVRAGCKTPVDSTTIGSAGLGRARAEGAEAAGISGFSALREPILRETLGTRFGTAWGLALLAWVAIGLALPRARRRAAMAIWLGGLATLLFAVPRGTRELEPADRSRLLVRFSPVALVAVAAILLTGLLQGSPAPRNCG